MTDWSQFSPVSAAPRRGGIDWSQFEPVDKLPKDDSDLLRGGKEAFQQLPQLGYGLVAGAGAVIESAFGEGGIGTGIKKAGVEGFQRWGEKIASQAKPSDDFDYSWERAKEGDFGALVDWLQHGIGYVGGQGIQMLASAGFGSVAGKFVLGKAAEQIAGGMVAKEVAALGSTEAGKKLAKDELAAIATRNVAGKIGQTAAVGAQAFGMEGGEIFGDLAKGSVDEGRSLTGEELAKAFGATLAAGGLEFVGDKIGLDLVLGKSPFLKPAQLATGVGGRVARGGLGAVASTPIEAGTEYLQTGFENYGKGEEAQMLPWMQSEKAQKDAFNAAMLGGLGGTVIGGAGGMLQGAKAPEPKPDPIKEIVDAPSVDAAIDATAKAVSEPAKSVDVAPSLIDELQSSARSPEQAIQAMEAAAQREGRLSVNDWSALETAPQATGEADWMADARAIAERDQAELRAEQRKAQIEAEPVDRAPRRRSEGIELQPADPVEEFIDDLRATNTPAARAYVQDFEAGRITREEVAARIATETPRTDSQIADERLAAAASQAPKPGDEGLLLTADGKSYGTRSAAVVRARREGLDPSSVIELADGYAVRPKETPSAQPDVADIAPSVPGAGAAGPGELGPGVRAGRPVADDASGAGAGDPVTAAGDSGRGVPAGRVGGSDGALIGPFKARQADSEAKRLTAETGQEHQPVSRERVDDEGYTVTEWFVAPVTPKSGMTPEEAKAYQEQANRERPFGKTWGEIEQMQGGRLKPQAHPPLAERVAAAKAKNKPDAVQDGRIVSDDVAPAGSTVVDGQGREYRVHSHRHHTLIAHPIVDGKPQISRDTAVRFYTNQDPALSAPGDNDRRDPIYAKAASQTGATPAPGIDSAPTAATAATTEVNAPSAEPAAPDAGVSLKQRIERRRAGREIENDQRLIESSKRVDGLKALLHCLTT